MKLCHHSLDNFFKKNEVAGAEFIKGVHTRLCTMGTACLIWKNSEKFKELKSLELKKVFCTFELYPQG